MQIDMQAAIQHLEQAERILLTAHVHPDGDAIGSCLALCHVLKKMGKHVQVVLDDHMPDIYDILPGFNEIKRYDGETLAADLVVLLDARPGRDGRICSSVSAPVLNIDHHASNDCSTDFAYVEPEAAATAEILYGLFREWGIVIDEDIASCLYTGIATDTGFFAFQNTKPEALEICADLLRAGAKPAEIASAVRRKSFHEVEELARGLGTMERFADGRAVGIFLDESFLDLELTDDLIDMARNIRGTELAVLLKAEGEDSCRVRMRSEELDVSKLAEALGGGGHREAAGATIMSNFHQARKIFMENVHSYLNKKDVEF